MNSIVHPQQQLSSHLQRDLGFDQPIQPAKQPSWGVVASLKAAFATAKQQMRRIVSAECHGPACAH